MTAPKTDDVLRVEGPTTRALRRAERPRRSFFAALFLEHVVAKAVALLFAGVAVALIDRELAVVLFDGELPIRVVAASDPAASAGRNELLLVTEDGVAVHRLGAATARVVVRGKKKVYDLVGRERGLVGRAIVRRAWLAGGYTSRQLDGSEFDLGAPVDSVRLEPAVQVDFDEEVAGSLPLAAEFRDVPPGLAAAATFRPPELRVLGARAWLAGGAAPERVVVDLDCAGRSTPFVVDDVPTPTDLRRRFVRPAPGATVKAFVTFAAAEDTPLVVEGVPLRFVGPPTNDLVFTPLPPADPVRPTVTVRLRGPKDQVAKYAGAAAAAELRKTLQAQVDTEPLAQAAAAYLDARPGEPPEETVAIEVLRIPEGLRFDHAGRVDVRITRRNP